MQKDLECIFSEWFDKADEDLAFASFALKETTFYSHICLLCQQAVEKYLKGFLAANKFPVKKIHNTATLAEKCTAINKKFLNHVRECKILDKYYIPTRYPVGIKLNINMADAKKAMETAKEISLLVKEIL